MSTISLPVPNGIVFVFDPNNSDVTIPKHIGGTLTQANETCVSVGTIAEVDGETRIHLEVSTNSRPIDEEPGYHKVFSGRIATPSGRIAIVTSTNQQLLSTSVTSKTTLVAVFVDDRMNPSTIFIFCDAELPSPYP